MLKTRNRRNTVKLLKQRGKTGDKLFKNENTDEKKHKRNTGQRANIKEG